MKQLTMVLESLGTKVKTPIIVYVDNIGAIFMAENVGATSHTKRIDLVITLFASLWKRVLLKSSLLRHQKISLPCLQRM
jgi:hypothetical protein